MDFWEILLTIFIPIILVLSIYLVFKIRREENRSDANFVPKLLICGIHGKMGSYVANALSSKYQIIGYDITSKPSKWSVFTDFDEAIMEEPDVAIDFTTDHTGALIASLLLMEIPVISGATGISLEDMMKLVTLAKENNTSFISLANFTLGIKLIHQWLKNDHQYYQAIISEAHHESKKDAPSGTAKLLADLMGIEYNMVEVERTKNFQAKHRIELTRNGESITIIHQINDRAAYLSLIMSYIEKVLNAPLIEVNYKRF